MRTRVDTDGPALGVLEDRGGAGCAPEASERFRTSYADSPLGLALLTPDGELFHANPALCRLLATAESDLVGRAFLDFVDTEDLVPAEDAIAAPPWAVGGLRSCSVRMVAVDGRSCWVDLTVHAVPACDGEASSSCTSRTAPRRCRRSPPSAAGAWRWPGGWPAG